MSAVPDRAEDGYYAVLAHASRCCFARVLMRRTDDGKRLYRCSNCDAEHEGRDPSVICGCGTRLKTGANPGLACAINDNPSPDCPSRIVIASP